MRFEEYVQHRMEGLYGEWLWGGKKSGPPPLPSGPPPLPSGPPPLPTAKSGPPPVPGSTLLSQSTGTDPSQASNLRNTGQSGGINPDGAGRLVGQNQAPDPLAANLPLQFASQQKQAITNITSGLNFWKQNAKVLARKYPELNQSLNGVLSSFQQFMQIYKKLGQEQNTNTPGAGRDMSDMSSILPPDKMNPNNLRFKSQPGGPLDRPVSGPSSNPSMDPLDPGTLPNPYVNNPRSGTRKKLKLPAQSANTAVDQYPEFPVTMNMPTF